MSMTQASEKASARTSKLEFFVQLMGRFVPDAITASVILLLILTVMALAMGNSAGKTLDRTIKDSGCCCPSPCRRL